MKNIIKISIATIIAILVLGTIVYANMPSANERIIKFNEHLIVERQKEWVELNIQKELIVSKMIRIQAEADMFRETISVLKNEPVGIKLEPTPPVDFQ
jgi:pentose-5-phosphate-3-epimerase